jgi:chromosome partitioning protein
MSSTTRIISVANSKGGVGKSVVSIMLAVAVAKEKGKKVLIIDCDSQGSITEMYNHEMELHDSDPAIEVEELTPRKVQTFLKRFGRDYDYIFIDVPRMTDKKKDNSTVMLLYNCDAVLVPIIGSEVDVLSSMDFLTILQEAKADKAEMDEELKFYGFINRRNLRKSNEEAEADMKKSGMLMFKNSLPDLRILTTPSFYKSILESAEGERRFRNFFNEFCRKFKIK